MDLYGTAQSQLTYIPSLSVTLTKINYAETLLHELCKFASIFVNHYNLTIVVLFPNLERLVKSLSQTLFPNLCECYTVYYQE